jgi:hypothetical protein
MQPVGPTQLSSVQLSPSSHVTAACSQAPAEQLSFVQASASSQSSGVKTQPSGEPQLSVVHGLASSQTRGV